MKILTTATRTALHQRRVKYTVLVEVQFKAGPVYFTISPMTISWGGKEWLGGGRMLDFKLAKEDATLGAYKGDLTLDGLDAAAISMAFNEDTEGAPITFRLLVVDPDTTAVVGDMVLARYTISEVQITPPSNAEQ